MLNREGRCTTRLDRIGHRGTEGQRQRSSDVTKCLFFFFPSLVMATQRVKTVGTEEGEEQRHVTGLGHNRDQG